MAFKISDAVDKPMNRIVDLMMKAILRMRGAKEIKSGKSTELVSKNWHSPY